MKSDLGSLDMHNRSAFAGCLLITFSAVTHGEVPTPPKNVTTASIPEASQPELTRRALPTDIFKPSEQVSEDYPVPFPVDI